MAYNESGELSPSQSYQLGGYTFELRSNYDGDEEVTGIVARMTYNGETKVQGIDIDGQVTIESWTVEANETEATVYAVVKKSHYIVTNGLVPTGGFQEVNTQEVETNYIKIEGTGVRFVGIQNEYNGDMWVVAASTDGAFFFSVRAERRGTTDDKTVPSYVYNYEGTPVNVAYWGPWTYPPPEATIPTIPVGSGGAVKTGLDAMLTLSGFDTSKLVGRFAIDIREADGGPDGDWDEPGDDGPPGTTLNVTVTGATAGSCTGTPADNETVKGYGDGGDGGNGGGGGAGASTVSIHEFATSLAESVQQEAISRGPGTGGPGSKGGKGGDGCILIFY